MDSQHEDPSDDDVTIVGDHELLVELRRVAAERANAPGPPLPPPVVPAAPAAPRAARRTAAFRRPAPPPPAPAPADPFGVDEWWDDSDGDGPSRLVWFALAIVVMGLAVVAAVAVLG